MATLLYDTLREPPKRGSVRELVLIQYVMRRENIQHARLRALAQVIIDQEKGVKAFEEYMKEAFPYLETAKRREHGKHMSVLMEEIKRGGLAITQKHETSMKSRLKTKVVERSAAPSTNAPNEDMARSIARRIGPSLPLWGRRDR
jgi:hypothetical protein